MGLTIAGGVVAFFSVLVFWRPHPLLFMVASGTSMPLGLYWFDVYTNDMGLAIALMLIVYSFFCAGQAFWSMFSGGKKVSK